MYKAVIALFSIPLLAACAGAPSSNVATQSTAPLVASATPAPQTASSEKVASAASKPTADAKQTAASSPVKTAKKTQPASSPKTAAAPAPKPASSTQQAAAVPAPKPASSTQQTAAAPAPKPASSTQQTAALSQRQPAARKEPAEVSLNGVRVTDIKMGNGPEAKTGQRLKVQYVGTLMNGTVIDTSAERGPFTFTLGGGTVIEGWDQGLVGMKTGGKRKLVIPPELAYGKNGVPPTIPPNSGLIFEVELLEIES